MEMVERFDVVFCEKNGLLLPGVVVSPNELNECLKTVILAPITGQISGFPCRIPVTLDQTKGEIAFDLLQSVLQSDIKKKIGSLPEKGQAEVLGLLKELFAD